jgi:hypothetical protein
MAAAVLLTAAWGISRIPDSALRSWIPPVGAPRGPVRILRFYATTGSIALGDKAQLCYGVENARSVRISPSIAPVVPAVNRCLEIVPDHTTHYTILAEGFDGHIAARFLTLVVETAPAPPRGRTNMAALPAATPHCMAPLAPASRSTHAWSVGLLRRSASSATGL